MAFPTFDARVDWDRDGFGSSGIDVLSDVLSMRLTESADGAAGDVVERLVIEVDNNDGKFHDFNTGSLLFGKLKPRRPVHVNVTWSGSTVGFFDGYVERISAPQLRGDRRAEIICTGHLAGWSALDVSMPLAARSYRSIRASAFSDVGLNSLLSFTDSPNEEIHYLPNFGYSGDLLSLLRDVNRATGSAHRLIPTSSFTTDRVAYSLMPRSQAQSGSTFVWTGSLDYERVTEWGQDVPVVNRQRVNGQSYTYATSRSTLFEYDSLPLFVPAGQTIDVWSTWPAPALDPNWLWTFTGTFSTTGSFDFGMGSLLRITATTDTTFTRLLQTGYLGTPRPVSETANNTTSQAAYDIQRGETIESDMIQSTTQAKAIADYLVSRFGTPARTTQILFENRFDTTLVARQAMHSVGQIGDVELGLSAWRSEIIARDLVVDLMGERVTEVLTLRERPPAISVFELGVSSLGGSAILAL